MECLDRDEDNPRRYVVDPKKAMMFWANQNIQAAAPSALGGNYRHAISALMNSQSPALGGDPSMYVQAHVRENYLRKLMEQLDG